MERVSKLRQLMAPCIADEEHKHHSSTIPFEEPKSTKACRPGQTMGNSHSHSLTQVPECGNKLNQAWESCTKIVDQVVKLLMQSGMTFKGVNQHTPESHPSHCDITHAKLLTHMILKCPLSCSMYNTEGGK